MPIRKNKSCYPQETRVAAVGVYLAGVREVFANAAVMCLSESDGWAVKLPPIAYTSAPSKCRLIHKVGWVYNRIPMASLKTPSTPSVARSLAIFELLSQSRQGMSLLDLSRELRVAKSSVHCILVTLERCGYVRRNERTSRYTLALKLFALANAALNGLELREQAAPLLRALADRGRLAVHMAILEGGEPVLIERVEPSGTARLATWIGKRMDVHCTALGKVLAADLREEELAELIRKRPLIRHNDNTIVSLRKLREDLDGVRVRGYAVDDEEEEIGMRCVGCPVLDRQGKTVAAISVSGTTDQITVENLPELSAALRSTAASLTQVLDFNVHSIGRTTGRPDSRFSL